MLGNTTKTPITTRWSSLRLKGAVVVVTGGSRGLGKELALAFAREGCQLIVGARTGLEELEQEIKGMGSFCQTCAVDLSSEQGLADFGEFIFRPSGRVDILVNNLGYTHPFCSVEKLDWKEIERSFHLNLFVPLSLIRLLLPVMRAQNSGTIVNIGSFSGRRAVPSLSAYSASKFALRGLTEAVAKELQGTEIVCFSASPGGMNTAMRAAALGAEDAARQQHPSFVAGCIIDAIKGQIPNGADLVVRGGKATVKLPEGNEAN